MRHTSVFIPLLLFAYQNINCEKAMKGNSETLVDQFNNYVDQTIDIINKRTTLLTKLPFYFNKGTWGYLFLNIDYSLKLLNGSLTGLSKLTRRGDAFIGYDRTSGNLTIAATLTSQPVQASYSVEVKSHGLAYEGKAVSSAAQLNIGVNLSISAANLRVSLDAISVTTEQPPNVTFVSSNPVLDYFAPLVFEFGSVSALTTTMLQSSIQSTIDILNSPSFGYY